MHGMDKAFVMFEIMVVNHVGTSLQRVNGLCNDGQGELQKRQCLVSGRGQHHVTPYSLNKKMRFRRHIHLTSEVYCKKETI